MKTFDPTKPVQTRDGRKARIISTDAKVFCDGVPQPILALVEVCDGKEDAVSYCLNGNYFPHSKDFCDSDLINIPEPPKLRPWRRGEQPIGKVVRRKDDKTELCVLLAPVGAFRTSIIGRGILENIENSTLLNHYEMEDGKPCGVEE